VFGQLREGNDRFAIPERSVFLGFDGRHARDDFASHYEALSREEERLLDFERERIRGGLSRFVSGQQMLLSLRSDELMIEAALDFFKRDADFWSEEYCGRDPSRPRSRLIDCFTSVAGSRPSESAALQKFLARIRAEWANGECVWLRIIERLRLRGQAGTANANFVEVSEGEAPPCSGYANPLSSEVQRALGEAAATSWPALCELLIAHDVAARVRIDPENLPRPSLLARKPVLREVAREKTFDRACQASLLEIAAGSTVKASQCFGGLLLFFKAPVSVECLRQALAAGNRDVARDVWNRLDEKAKIRERVRLARTAADFHFTDAVGWLLGSASFEEQDAFASFAVSHRLADSLLALQDEGYNFTSCGRETARKISRWPELGSLVRFGRRESWTEACLSTRSASLREQLVRESPPAPPGFARLAALACESDGSGGRAAFLAELAQRFRDDEANPVACFPDPAWRPLVKGVGASELDGPDGVASILACGDSPVSLGGVVERLHAFAFAGAAREVVAELDKNPGNVDVCGWRGRTALSRAAEGGCSKMVRLLLDRGAEVNCRNKVGRTALHNASTAEVVRALCGAGADVCAKDTGGVTPLMEARSRHREDVVVALLEAGADAGDPSPPDRGLRRFRERRASPRGAGGWRQRSGSEMDVLRE
jgi:hypothetical protein